MPGSQHAEPADIWERLKRTRISGGAEAGGNQPGDPIRCKAHTLENRFNNPRIFPSSVKVSENRASFCEPSNRERHRCT